MAEAPTKLEMLRPDDASNILDEILDANARSFLIGLRLHVPLARVQAIHLQYQDPVDKLLHVIIEFLRQAEPTPTWRIIIEALKSPAVGLSALAKRIEATHFPTQPETTVNTETVDDEEVKSKPPPGPSTLPSVNGDEFRLHGTLQEVEESIHFLEFTFDQLKRKAITLLDASCFEVKDVVYELSTLPVTERGQHKQFLEENIKKLRANADNRALFSHLNLHWTYLSPGLLQQLVRNISNLAKMKDDMKTYMSMLHEFRTLTPLKLFCQHDKKCMELPKGFSKIVAQIRSENIPPERLTLQHIEDFRIKYGDCYQLRDFALMLQEQILNKSFVVVFLVPESIVEILKKNIPTEILREFGVIELEINGTCVFGGTSHVQSTLEQIPSPTYGVHFLFSTSHSAASAASLGVTEPDFSGAAPYAGELSPTSGNGVLLVKHPIDEFFCPVTNGLLLQPHLTSCCGKHLSYEAATKMQKEKGACPLCYELQWSTMLNKHFQHQVNSLDVLCCHKDRGCDWHGPLPDLCYHVQSCTRKDAPVITNNPQYNSGIMDSEKKSLSSFSPKEIYRADEDQEEILEMEQKELVLFRSSVEQQPKQKDEHLLETQEQKKTALAEAKQHLETKQAELIQLQREVVLAHEHVKIKEEHYKCPGLVTESDRTVAIVGTPYGVDFTSSGKMIVSGWGENQVFKINDSKIGEPMFDKSKQMLQPADIMIDNEDNIYVSSKHKLQKFSSSGQLLRSVGCKGKGKEEFDDPRGITQYGNRVYVSDRNNHRIQVFDLDLNHIDTIGSHGRRRGQLDAPFDVKFDDDGNMYIVELGNRRVQVRDASGKFRFFGQGRKHNVGLPTGLHVEKNIVYVSDFANDCIVVYKTSGSYVTTIGSHGQGVIQLHSPYCMTSRAGKLYVCDSGNNRVQTFDLVN